MGDNFLSRLSGNIYLSNITWLMAERVVRLLVTAIVGIYVARYLGPQRFGLLSFSQSYLAIFIILATLGLDGIVIRELVKRPTERAEVLGTAFILKALGCVLMWVILGLSLVLFHVQRQESMLVSILAIGVIFQAFSVIDFFFQARVESKYVARAQLAQLVLSSALKLYLVTVSAELIWFAVVLTLDHLFLAVGLYIVYRAKGGEVSTWRFRAYLAFSGPAGQRNAGQWRTDHVLRIFRFGADEQRSDHGEGAPERRGSGLVLCRRDDCIPVVLHSGGAGFDVQSVHHQSRPRVERG
jgi:O-antigen/teichoic acid export membrane protein